MRFFESQPVGRILNRFSQDQAVVDELLPSCSCDVIVVIIKRRFRQKLKCFYEEQGPTPAAFDHRITKKGL